MAKPTKLKAVPSSSSVTPEPRIDRNYAAIKIGGRTYKACFDYGSLEDAEEMLNDRYPEANVNLLLCLPKLNLKNARTLFAASLMHYQPELEFEDAKNLLSRDNVYAVIGLMIEAWRVSMPAPDTAGGEGKDPQ